MPEGTDVKNARHSLFRARFDIFPSESYVSSKCFNEHPFPPFHPHQNSQLKQRVTTFCQVLRAWTWKLQVSVARKHTWFIASEKSLFPPNGNVNNRARNCQARVRLNITPTRDTRARAFTRNYALGEARRRNGESCSRRFVLWSF